MTTAQAFRSGVEARDLDAVMELFTEEPVLHSPITHEPFEGRSAVRMILSIVVQVLRDLRYTDELTGNSATHALVFRARVGDRDVEGIDLLRLDAAGRIRDLTVLIRPRSGIEALLREVAPRLAATSDGSR